MKRYIFLIKGDSPKTLSRLLKTFCLTLLVLGFLGVFSTNAAAQNGDSKRMTLLKGKFNWQKKEVVEFSLIKDLDFSTATNQEHLVQETNLGLRSTRRLLKMKYISFIVNFRKEIYFA